MTTNSQTGSRTSLKTDSGTERPRPYRRRRLIATRLMLALGFTACFGEPTLANECPVEEGQAIEIQGPANVWAQLRNLQLEKDEFETSALFAARIEAAKQEAERVVAVATTYDPDMTTYDADRQVFTITIYAWDNLNDGIAREWADLHGEVLPRLIDDRAAIGLHAEEHANGKELYSVFDEILPGEKEWRADSTMTLASGTIELQVPAITLPAPIAEARVLKRTMRIAAMIRPKAPYFATATSFPLSSRGPSTTRILIADILCVAITDQEGRILKVVERAQGH